MRAGAGAQSASAGFLRGLFSRYQLDFKHEERRKEEEREVYSTDMCEALHPHGSSTLESKMGTEAKPFIHRMVATEGFKARKLEVVLYMLDTLAPGSRNEENRGG